MIKNKTRKTVLAKSFKRCVSIPSKARGLMFTKKASVERNALLFEFDTARWQSMHMFFVFYPIDVLFIDERCRVVDMKECFRPFTVYNSGKNSKYVLELPYGVISKSKTLLGDEIGWGR